jgi:hypothetical protein
MLIDISQVRKGDTIVDGRSETEVKRIKHDACSSFGTHVNDRECYERGSKVRIKPGKAGVDSSVEENEDWSPGLLV